MVEPAVEGGPGAARNRGADPFAEGAWRKSGYCGANSGCLEVRRLGAGTTGIRDSELDPSPVLVLDRDALAGLLARIKTGDLDL